MKKAILTLSVLTFSIIQAGVQIQYPLEEMNRGALPDGSINFINSTGPVTPTPDPEPVVPAGPLDCVAHPEDNPDECTASLTSWDNFADTHSLSKNWNSAAWISKNLSDFPTEPYPVANLSGDIILNLNPLNNLGGFSSVKSVGGRLILSSVPLTNLNGFSGLTTVGADFQFSSNTLTDVSGLSNLTSVGGSFQLSSNTLTNVSGLSNLNYVGGNFSFAGNRSITDLSGISNVQVAGTIMIYKPYTGPKLAASSRFCMLNILTKFRGDIGYAPKSSICAN